MAITQYGGVGKTQLMAAFAEKAEKEGWVPGGSFWVAAHGTRSVFVESLAEFTESLTQSLLSDADRTDVVPVCTVLRRKLDAIDEPWLLCVDNADSAELNPVPAKLAEMSRLAGGWVVVTSRQGGSTLWTGMTEEQKICLSLSEGIAALIALIGASSM